MEALQDDEELDTTPDASNHSAWEFLDLPRPANSGPGPSFTFQTFGHLDQIMEPEGSGSFQYAPSIGTENIRTSIGEEIGVQDDAFSWFSLDPNSQLESTTTTASGPEDDRTNFELESEGGAL